MKRTEIRQTIITVVACIITGSITLFLMHRTQKKIAVVDAIKLFNSYAMKKELEAKAGGQLQYLNKISDSIKQVLTMKSKEGKTPKSELQLIYKAYINSQTILEQAYQQSNETINEEVWKRLNPAIDEFGEINGYRLIIGANGRGSVLYNNDYYDETKEVIDFVNDKYENGN